MAIRTTNNLEHELLFLKENTDCFSKFYTLNTVFDGIRVVLIRYRQTIQIGTGIVVSQLRIQTNSLLQWVGSRTGLECSSRR